MKMLTKSAVWTAKGVAMLFVTFGVLGAANYLRFDGRGFGVSAKAFIERSRRIGKSAGHDYQNNALARLGSNPFNGTCYRLADLVSKVEATGSAADRVNRGLEGSLFTFEFREDRKPGLRLGLGRSVMRVSGSRMIVEQKGEDYLVSDVPIDIADRDIGEVVVRMRTDKATRVIIGLCGSADDGKVHASLLDEVWRRQVSADLTADGAFHTYAIDAKGVSKLSQETAGSRRLKTLYIRPSSTDGARVEFDSIRFVPVTARYFRQARGNVYESLGMELRQALYMLVPQVLEYSLRIPEDAPYLEFGAGILVDDEPVMFEVAIHDDRRTTTVCREKLTNATAWHDQRVDLASWAGQNVRLRMAVSGSEKNVALWSDPVVAAKPKGRFSAIMILEDALRPDHLSMNGYHLPTSPIRDALMAEGGVVFVNAISQACWTRSSIPSIMTSLLPSTTGVWHFSDYLEDDYLTLAEVMRSQGFHTASFIQNENAGAFNGVHQGFSQTFDPSTLGGETEGMLGDRLKQWLAGHRDQNFFLYLHIRDPHGPYNPPVPFDRWYKETVGKGKPVPRKYLDPEFVAKPTDESRRALYDGEVAHNDSLFPALLEELKALRIERDTLLVFLSDHGEHLGEHGFWGHSEPGYIQTIHVPLDLVYPARFRQPMRIEQTVQLTDVMPTILELAGIDTKNLLMQGDSLVDLIEKRNTSYFDNRVTVSEEPYQMSSTSKEPQLCGSLFFRDWHFISSQSLYRGSYYLPAVLRLEAFDFHEDRGEQWPLFSLIPDLYVKFRFAGVIKELQTNDIEAWKKWRSSGDGEAHKVDPGARERLKALGYVK